MKKKAKTLKEQLTEIKAKTVTVLSQEVLFDFEEEVLNELYELVNSVLLEKINSKRYTMEEYADARIMEYVIVLETSENKQIQQIVRLLKKGLNW